MDALWSANLTPQALVRMSGDTRGRRAIRDVLQRRITNLTDAETYLLAEYLYNITVAAPSGEFAMNSLLRPGVGKGTIGVFAREPLDPLLLQLAPHIELKVLYGDHDWMRPNEASARSVIQQLGERASLHIIEKAGHHLYMDNAEEFERHI